MDESLESVSRTGKVKDLYGLIRKDGNLFKHIDEVEFVDTPLHIAADEGCIDLAMEIMNLKPSYARKLNQDGLSPMHLSVKKGHTEMTLCLLEIDRDLVRVRGRKGKTPLHYVSKQGNPDGLLERFLEASLDCILDVTTKNQTALHIAAEQNRLDVFKVLIQALQKSSHCQEVVNRKDKDGNTALHIAAKNNQPQMLKLLLKCKADKFAINQNGFTPLAVAHQVNSKDSINVLDCWPYARALSMIRQKCQKMILKNVTKASQVIFQGMDSISSDDRNALLVILALLLTATYQASLSPPGGVLQGSSSSNSISTDENSLGKSVMDQQNFLLFYFPVSVVFLVTLFLTLGLLKPYPSGFRTSLHILLAFLAISFSQSISFIAPTDLVRLVISAFSVLVFVLMMFMCIAYRLSVTSVLILGCWLVSMKILQEERMIQSKS